MKIAFLVGQFPKLSETFILNQITGLLDRGHEVDIYADSSAGESKIHANVESYRLLERTHYFNMPRNQTLGVLNGAKLVATNFHKNPQALLSSWNKSKFDDHNIFLRAMLPHMVVSFLNDSTYDIIHCHFGLNGLRGAMLSLAGVLKGKLITSFHGHDLNSSPRRYGNDMYAKLFQTGDYYTVNSTYTGKKAAALGCPPERIIKLPMGLDLSRYTFQPRLLHNNQSVKLVTVARLTEKKGIEYAIKALAEVLKDHTNIEYSIAGDGALRSSLEALTTELNLAEKVKFLGWQTQEELYNLYEQSHIFVLPSVTASDGDQEGQGLVLQEAQAMGLPVLSTLHNGIPDSVLDGESAFLVPERDVNALSAKLRFLVEHPNIWLPMGQVGRAFVEENFDINRLNDELVGIYEKALLNSSVKLYANANT